MPLRDNTLPSSLMDTAHLNTVFVRLQPDFFDAQRS